MPYGGPFYVNRGFVIKFWYSFISIWCGLVFLMGLSFFFPSLFCIQLGESLEALNYWREIVTADCQAEYRWKPYP